MLTHKDHFHGSDLEKIEQIYGIRNNVKLIREDNRGQCQSPGYLTEVAGASGKTYRLYHDLS